MENYYTYIIYSEKLYKYYTGSTSDIEKRLERHNAGATKFTKNGRPWKIVYYEQFENRKEAVNREMYIKKQKSRIFIVDLIESDKYKEE